MKNSIKWLFILSLLCLSACSLLNNAKWTVEQGNMVSTTTLSRLKIGMQKEEVAQLMGNSLVNSTFNDNRWDYVYLSGNVLSDLEKKHVSLYFKNDTLTRIERSS